MKTAVYIIGLLLMASFTLALPSAFEEKQYTYLGKWVPQYNVNGMDYFVPYDDNSIYYANAVSKCQDTWAKHTFNYCRHY